MGGGAALSHPARRSATNDAASVCSARRVKTGILISPPSFKKRRDYFTAYFLYVHNLLPDIPGPLLPGRCAAEPSGDIAGNSAGQAVPACAINCAPL